MTLSDRPAEEIEINLAEEDFRAAIRSGSANFFSTGRIRNNFLFTAEQEWREWTNLNFAATELKNILRQVHFAVSQDENKPSFRGFYWKPIPRAMFFVCLPIHTGWLALKSLLVKKPISNRSAC